MDLFVNKREYYHITLNLLPNETKSNDPRSIPQTIQEQRKLSYIFLSVSKLYKVMR